MTLAALSGTAHAVYISTDAAAQRLGLRPQTLRAAVCRAGHYGGITPRKKCNRMLSWPANLIDRLAAGLPVAEPSDLSTR